MNPVQHANKLLMSGKYFCYRNLERFTSRKVIVLIIQF